MYYAVEQGSKLKYSDYYVDGIAKDQVWIVNHREMLEHYTHQDMRDHGYIPVLDIDPVITWEYDKKTGNFRYRIQVKGQRVGKKNSITKLGILSKEGVVLDLDVKEAAVV